MTVTWNQVSEDRYDEMLGVLPPAIMTGLGFLVGEPQDHSKCPVTGKFGALFSAFANVDDEFFEASEPMTVAGFKTLAAKDVS